MQMNEQQGFAALGIALNRLWGSIAGIFDKTLCYKLPIACSSREGIFAAELAERGFQGIADPFMGPRGYFSMFCTSKRLSNRQPFSRVCRMVVSRA